MSQLNEKKINNKIYNSSIVTHYSSLIDDSNNNSKFFDEINSYDIQNIIEPYNITHKKKFLIWIDENHFKNNDDQKYSEYFLDFDKKVFTFCDSGIEAIKDILFDYCYVIVSGKLFQEFIFKIKNEINNLKCIPIIFIFTSKTLKDIFLNKKYDQYIKPETYEYIKHSFFNYGGIYNTIVEINSFIQNFEKKIKNNNNNFYNKEIEANKGCLIFQKIYDSKNLILPFLYSQIQKDNINISDDDVKTFLKFINEKNYKYFFYDLLNPLLYLDNFPHEILSKIFCRFYSFNCAFHREMNFYLLENKHELYSTYIKMLYKGLYINSLKFNNKNELYRSCLISKKELSNIIKHFNFKEEGLPYSLLYSRAFLSFTKDNRELYKFFKEDEKDKENLIPIVFKINSNNNIKITQPTNADFHIDKISLYENEKEVLFFPFSSFAVVNIRPLTERDVPKLKIKLNPNSKFIELEYLGKYESDIKKELKNIDIKKYLNELEDDKFFNDIQSDFLFYESNNNINNNINNNSSVLSNILIDIVEKNQTFIINEEIENQEKNFLKYSNLLILMNEYYCYSNENKIVINNNIKKENNENKFELIIEYDDIINYLEQINPNKIMACSFDNSILIINLDYNKKLYYIEQNLKGHRSIINKIIKTKENKICSCSFDGTLKIWKENLNYKYEFEKDLIFMKNVAFYSILEIDDFIISMGKTNLNNLILIIHKFNNKKNQIYNNNINLKRDNLIEINDKNFAIGGNNIIYLYNLNGQNIFNVTKLKLNLVCMFKLNDNSYIFTGDKGEIIKTNSDNLKNFEIKKNQFLHEKEINSIKELKFSDKYLLITRCFEKIKIWEI